MEKKVLPKIFKKHVRKVEYVREEGLLNKLSSAITVTSKISVLNGNEIAAESWRSVKSLIVSIMQDSVWKMMQ